MQCHFHSGIVWCVSIGFLHQIPILFLKTKKNKKKTKKWNRNSRDENSIYIRNMNSKRKIIIKEISIYVKCALTQSTVSHWLNKNTVFPIAFSSFSLNENYTLTQTKENINVQFIWTLYLQYTIHMLIINSLGHMLILHSHNIYEHWILNTVLATRLLLLILFSNFERKFV